MRAVICRSFGGPSSLEIGAMRRVESREAQGRVVLAVR
jgi:hypothetical protein